VKGKKNSTVSQVFYQGMNVALLEWTLCAFSRMFKQFLNHTSFNINLLR